MLSPGALGMGGRAVDGSGLENRQGATPRGFESHPIRHTIEQPANDAMTSQDMR